MILNKKIMLPSTFILVTCHIVIFYFWIFDFEKITTPYGLTIWIVSTICGLLLYYHFKNQKSNKVIFIANSLLLIISSSFMIFLGIVTGIIFVTVNSMN
ncbi:TPA: hypothetical protein ROX87_001782 [Bacillus thuringiensis]|uniref:Uncharacterized protein n=3 Tax=Bacillus cereus group TaxID=86661 RepID=A0A9X6YFM1_BACTU|nr:MULTISPECIES: hypothetical protein [Bacillus]EJS56972.1 hypothetical protein ICE_02309 [Bacillus cereus BAG1X1-2]EJV81781.1 hypothetical protein IGE_02630 [Bacillus cereus HuB1-1]EPF12533.1 hypothetical protein ICA_01850 [Bacillus cereus BAG1O-3]KAB2447632.1 hypothetical protein F8165_25440 [Bacillus cereus]KAB2486628.1 hypothetical protein F8157_08655 [Bacillus cereus]